MQSVGQSIPKPPGAPLDDDLEEIEFPDTGDTPDADDMSLPGFDGDSSEPGPMAPDSGS